MKGIWHASYEPQHPAVSEAERKCVGVSHADAPLRPLQWLAHIQAS